MYMTKSLPQKAWVVSVNMGYGHDRAAYSLRHLAHQGILHADIYSDIPSDDREVWERSREFYEFISRFSKVPIIGKAAFDFYDKLQSIPPFYPRRDLTDPNFPLKHIFRTIEKGWGKHLIRKLSKNPLPLISTFFIPAFMAEEFDYPEEIYCVICDADFSRSWVPLKPAKSRIRYLAPTFRVAERLKLYGVSEDRIFVTGFPLPKENLGGETLGTLRRDLGARLLNLDPKGRYFKDHAQTVREQVDGHRMPVKPTHPLTLTFAVGGAGAQRELGRTVVQSLVEVIRTKQLHLNLIAGTRKDVADFFLEVARENDLEKALGKNLEILFARTKEAYFTRFNRLLRVTDILWTKPSELSFFAALGLPIIMAPPIGSQEKFNRTWLRSVGAGISQEDPRYANEWLFDWLNSGWFAEAAMEGFLEAPRLGTYNIEKIVAHKPEEMQEIENVLQY
ncbi:MAG: hypothetical protein AAB444_01045 [Patescibacteria group bacterium]